MSGLVCVQTLPNREATTRTFNINRLILHSTVPCFYVDPKALLDSPLWASNAPHTVSRSWIEKTWGIEIALQPRNLTYPRNLSGLWSGWRIARVHRYW
jgi:hypothetical protein